VEVPREDLSWGSSSAHHMSGIKQEGRRRNATRGKLSAERDLWSGKDLCGRVASRGGLSTYLHTCGEGRLRKKKAEHERGKGSKESRAGERKVTTEKGDRIDRYPFRRYRREPAAQKKEELSPVGKSLRWKKKTLRRRGICQVMRENASLSSL